VQIRRVAKSICVRFQRRLTLQADYNTIQPGQGSCSQTLAACSICNISTHSANGWRPQCCKGRRDAESHRKLRCSFKTAVSLVRCLKPCTGMAVLRRDLSVPSRAAACASLIRTEPLMETRGPSRHLPQRRLRDPSSSFGRRRHLPAISRLRSFCYLS
jgi:hypothetical protein